MLRPADAPIRKFVPHELRAGQTITDSLRWTTPKRVLNPAAGDETDDVLMRHAHGGVRGTYVGGRNGGQTIGGIAAYGCALWADRGSLRDHAGLSLVCYPMDSRAPTSTAYW